MTNTTHVDFTDTQLLDRRLHLKSLRDARARGLSAIAVSANDTILARCGLLPIWVTRKRESCSIDLVSLPPDEIEGDECLRDHLRGDNERFIGLLPLVHFLRKITKEVSWIPPPLRACFVIDDPNLHWFSYGYIRFDKLAKHAAEHGYHLALSIIPLDMGFNHPAVSRLFRHKGTPLSIIVHGNNHVKNELALPTSERAALQILAQALRRVNAFERRVGVSISRVMSPPHVAVSEMMSRVMLLLGYDALCVSKPYPWLEHPPRDRPLAGWEAAELVAGGLPVILWRGFSGWRRFSGHRDDIILRAFLDQPIIILGHHDDLVQGLDVLSEMTEQINSLGEVRWGSFSEITQSNFLMRKEGHTLRVKLFSRRVLVKVPEGIDQVIVEKPLSHGKDEGETLICGDIQDSLTFSPSGWISNPIPVRSFDLLELSLLHPEAVDPNLVPPPPWSPWPIIRRTATAICERCRPLLSRN